MSCTCICVGKCRRKGKIGKSECEVSGVKNFPLPLVKHSFCFLFSVRLLLRIVVVAIAGGWKSGRNNGEVKMSLCFLCVEFTRAKQIYKKEKVFLHFLLFPTLYLKFFLLRRNDFKILSS